jgi:hypothetical protein
MRHQLLLKMNNFWFWHWKQSGWQNEKSQKINYVTRQITKQIRNIFKQFFKQTICPCFLKLTPLFELQNVVLSLKSFSISQIFNPKTRNCKPRFNEWFWQQNANIKIKKPDLKLSFYQYRKIYFLMKQPFLLFCQLELFAMVRQREIKSFLVFKVPLLACMFYDLTSRWSVLPGSLKLSQCALVHFSVHFIVSGWTLQCVYSIKMLKRKKLQAFSADYPPAVIFTHKILQI